MGQPSTHTALLEAALRRVEVGWRATLVGSVQGQRSPTRPIALLPISATVRDGHGEYAFPGGSELTDSNYTGHPAMPHSTASLLDAFVANLGRDGNPFPGPFGSPLEERFADALRPHLAPGVRVEQQRVHYTAIGRFVLDFCFTTPSGFCVAVECDGAAFHERTADDWRDAALIGERKIDLMVRIDGRSLYSVPADVLYLLSTIAPSLVSARGRQNIVKLSTAAVRRYDRQTPGLLWVKYPNVEDLRAPDAARYRDADDPDAADAVDPW
ncbi:hypothetical protein [Gemmatimonas sp.]|uniref:hypothetical protein n=1 Tax=Gemmatimonas sp. TaxID=1962908 RepID=UPI00286E1713|nr:hypothetical protein [Gemmatimonas sp.]